MPENMPFTVEARRLRSWLQAYYAVVSTKMLRRGWIDQGDYDTLIADVRLRGSAGLLLKGNDIRPEEPCPRPASCRRIPI